MKTKRCERCHEEKSTLLFRGRSDFIMPWCRECRALDPTGAKLVNDRLRQAQLSEEALKAKNERRAQRAREIRAEVRSAQNTACELALDALNGIDLSTYQGREKREIQSELRRIKDVVKSLKP
jgi:hypothetical protein